MDKKVISTAVITAVLTVGLKELVDYAKIKYVMWKAEKMIKEL